MISNTRSKARRHVDDSRLEDMEAQSFVFCAGLALFAGFEFATGNSQTGHYGVMASALGGVCAGALAVIRRIRNH